MTIDQPCSRSSVCRYLFAGGARSMLIIHCTIGRMPQMRKRMRASATTAYSPRMRGSSVDCALRVRCRRWRSLCSASSSAITTCEPYCVTMSSLSVPLHVLR